MSKAIVADTVHPRPIMDSELSPSGLSESGADREAPDFTFAFDDVNFSDRVLRIEIVPDLPEHPKSDGEGCSTATEWARNRKRRRAEVKRESAEDILVDHEEQVINCNLPDTENDVAYENQGEEAGVMVESPSNVGTNLGDEAAHSNDSSWSMDCSTVLKVKTMHISSPILAAKSPFFYKLFSKEMKESEQRQVTLRIHASEEAAFMDLLNFMYSNTLSSRTPLSLLDVFRVADKFEVVSCMRYCSKSLRKLPMTCEYALRYLDLPSSGLMADAVQPLTDAAKQFLAARYKEITKFQDEVLKLPLAGFEAVLSSDDLQVASEDSIFDFVLKWARSHYPKLEERREILASRLGRLIRFPHMSCRKLRKVQFCNDFSPELVSKIVMEALFFKVEAPHRQQYLANAVNRRFVERSYKYRPFKVVNFLQPHESCIVFLDLKREECARLFPAGRLYSQAFHLGGQGFFLSAHCNMDQQSSFHCFGLFLGMQEKGVVSFAVDYEFSARSKPGEAFLSKFKGNYTFTGGKAVGYRNLFGIPWTAFMADDSIYFLNGVLHLEAKLTIRQ